MTSTMSESDEREAPDASGEAGLPEPESVNTGSLPGDAPAPKRGTAAAFAIYTGLRILIFIAVAAVLFAVGVSTWWVNLPIAILISGLISLVALERFRIDAGASLERRGGLTNPFAGLKDRMAAAASAEDAADDADRAAHGDPPPTRPTA